jgi:HSP20 family molecular chaperone IbpA
LPNNINENDITANFKDGILNIEITKKLENSTKSIEVKAQ